MTADDFDVYVRGIGYEVEIIAGADNQSYSVVRNLEIPTGSLGGRQCDVAIQRNASVPYVVPQAIHTRPALVPMAPEPLKTQASGIGPEWQYWSRRFDRTPTPKGIWTHILTVLGDDRWPTS